MTLTSCPQLALTQISCNIVVAVQVSEPLYHIIWFLIYDVLGREFQFGYEKIRGQRNASQDVAHHGGHLRHSHVWDDDHTGTTPPSYTYRP